MRRVLIAVSGLVFKNDDGQDLVEYALLVALIALLAITGVSSMGQAISGVLWQGVANGLGSAL
jgi:Flp pilus assembly pilin Flp